MKSKIVTTVDIARRLGISQPTVSQALGPDPARYRVAPATVKRVRAAALSMGYRPNASARAFRSGRFGAAALILSADVAGRSTLPRLLLSGLVNALEERGMHLTVTELTDANLTDEKFVPKILREWMADGLLVNYNRDFPKQMVELIENHALPAVWINAKRDADCVYPDDWLAAREATRRLIDLGHRRIAYTCFASDEEGTRHYSETDRMEAYEEAMREAGLTPRTINRRSETVPAGFMAWHEIVGRALSGPDRPTAILDYGPPIVVQRAIDRCGLVVPRDLSLIRFDDTASTHHPATMIVPQMELARKSVKMLIEKIESPKRHQPPCPIPFGFHPGNSLAPPPAHA
jgi:LacI family transcriptional regulator